MRVVVFASSMFMAACSTAAVTCEDDGVLLTECFLIILFAIGVSSCSVSSKLERGFGGGGGGGGGGCEYFCVMLCHCVRGDSFSRVGDLIVIHVLWLFWSNKPERPGKADSLHLFVVPFYAPSSRPASRSRAMGCVRVTRGNKQKHALQV